MASEDNLEEKPIGEEAKMPTPVPAMTAEELTKMEQMLRANREAFWGPFEGVYGCPVVNGLREMPLGMPLQLENQLENDKKKES